MSKEVKDYTKEPITNTVFNIGKTIKFFRKKSGHNNLLKLSRECGIEYNTLTKLETNSSVVGYAILHEICNLYNVNIHDILLSNINVNNLSLKALDIVEFGGLVHVLNTNKTKLNNVEVDELPKMVCDTIIHLFERYRGDDSMTILARILGTHNETIRNIYKCHRGEIVFLPQQTIINNVLNLFQLSVDEFMLFMIDFNKLSKLYVDENNKYNNLNIPKSLHKLRNKNIDNYSTKYWLNPNKYLSEFVNGRIDVDALNIKVKKKSNAPKHRFYIGEVMNKYRIKNTVLKAIDIYQDHPKSLLSSCKFTIIESDNCTPKGSQLKIITDKLKVNIDDVVLSSIDYKNLDISEELINGLIICKDNFFKGELYDVQFNEPNQFQHNICEALQMIIDKLYPTETLYKIGKETLISRTILNAVRNKTYSPKPKSLHQISSLLGVNIDTVLMLSINNNRISKYSGIDYSSFIKKVQYELFYKII